MFALEFIIKLLPALQHFALILLFAYDCANGEDIAWLFYAVCLYNSLSLAVSAAQIL